MNSSDLPNDIKWSINEYLVDTKTIYNNRRDLINELKPVICLLDANFSLCYKKIVKIVIDTINKNRQMDIIKKEALEVKWGICDCCSEILDVEKIISLKKKLCHFWRKYKYTSDINILIDNMDVIVSCIYELDPSQKALDYFFSCESLDNLSKDYNYLIERFLNEYYNNDDSDSD